MYITSTTADIVAILSREGKQRLADNSANFKITGFKFSDDEIDYSLYDGSSSDAINTDILNLPILEPSSNGNGNAAQRFELKTFNNGILNISEITTNLSTSQIFKIFGNPRPFDISFIIKTLYGYDTIYYLESTNSDIISLDSNVLETTKDPDKSQTLQNQSVGYTKMTVFKNGTASIEITGANTKKTYKKQITISFIGERTTVVADETLEDEVLRQNFTI